MKLQTGDRFVDIPLDTLFAQDPEPSVVHTGVPGTIIPPNHADRPLIQPVNPVELPSVRAMLPEGTSVDDTLSRPSMRRLLREGCRFIALRYLPEAMRQLEDPTTPLALKTKLFDIVLTAALADKEVGSRVNADGHTETVLVNSAVIALPPRVDAALVLAAGAEQLGEAVDAIRPQDALQALARERLQTPVL